MNELPDQLDFDSEVVMVQQFKLLFALGSIRNDSYLHL